MGSWRFKLLYDGECPFCRREMEWLKRRDRAGRLAVEDISALGFDPGKYGLSRDEVTCVIHGLKRDGTVLRGMDAIREACKVVGLGWLVAPTRLPLVRSVSDGLYGLFARYRAPLSRVVGGGCPGGSCAVHSPGKGRLMRDVHDRRRVGSVVTSESSCQRGAKRERLEPRASESPAASFPFRRRRPRSATVTLRSASHATGARHPLCLGARRRQRLPLPPREHTW